jgi:hypothetical protein
VGACNSNARRNVRHRAEHPPFWGCEVVIALDNTLHDESDPVADLERFTACVTHGYFPPEDVLRRLTAAFTKYLQGGEPGSLERRMGLAATRGTRPPVKAARENRVLRDALWLMATLEQSAAARIREAALLVAAKLRVERRLDRSVKPLPESTLEHHYRRGFQETRRKRRAPILGHRPKMLTAEEAKDFLARFPDADLEVRVAKKRILAAL